MSEATPDEADESTVMEKRVLDTSEEDTFAEELCSGDSLVDAAYGQIKASKGNREQLVAMHEEVKQRVRQLGGIKTAVEQANANDENNEDDDE